MLYASFVLRKFLRVLVKKITAIADLRTNINESSHAIEKGHLQMQMMKM